MERKQSLDKLIDKYLSGQASAEEQAKLERAYQAAAKRSQIPDQHDMDSIKLDQIGRESWMQLMSRITETRVQRLSPWKKWAGIAAAAVLLFAVGLFFLDIRHETIDNRLTATEILPGGNRATLTLADGRTVALSEAHSGIIIGDSIIRYQDGSHIELSPAGGGIGRMEDIKELVLTTPKGGTYNVVLPDGSKVWLNAGTTLKYPSRFDGKERIVELEGEAYFEIVRSEVSPAGGGRGRFTANPRTGASVHQPFRVVSKGQTIEVLGTSFNISAYADEPETKTTLVEGAIQVSAILSPAGADKGSSFAQNGPDKSEIASARTNPTLPRDDGAVLIPGQQSSLSNGNIIIRQVDVSQFTAWKTGRFVFEKTPLPEILRQLARWYDVEFDYPAGRAFSTFSGSIRRDQPIQEVLERLSETQLVNFEIKGRRVVVK